MRKTVTILLFLTLILSTNCLLFNILGGAIKGVSNLILENPLLSHNRQKMKCAVKDGVEDFSVYKQLGLPDQVIYELLHRQKNALASLEEYFKRFTVHPRELQRAIEKYVDYLLFIEDEFFSDVDNIVAGNDVEVNGENNFIKGNRLKVWGSNNYVMDGQYSRRPILGDNLLRIGRYEIDIKKVNQIGRNPYKAINLLSMW